MRPVIVSLSAALLLGAFGSQASAQTKPAVPTPAPATAPATEKPPQPTRTEIVTFENWRMTCNEFAESKKRTCVGQLQATKPETGQLLFGWTIGFNAEGVLESAIVTLTGVAIPKGLDLRFGQAAVRKLSYATCEPTYCTAQMPIDAGLRKEIVAAEAVEVVLYGSTGNNLKLAVPIKGIEKLLASLKN
ncbi:hypothetical protein EYW49_13375 [Siculibacillus lacustris]|uniref:Invasion associated locus B family protein n=1 Tax=Siculibacillus lacustris TaxID=1549641 RepID=A0A4Q9VM26_9HYPH|nr:invasion associated locus B family protein [Siculibacillus lacustris]TBW36585.1 hypothetical protein EYW49_13375 [Siculibacillus lacustris]